MLRRINYKDNKEIKHDIKPLFKEAFPWQEVPLFSWLLSGAKAESNNLCGYYDEKDFIGFTHTVEIKGQVYLFLLAVSKDKRGQHYGEQILADIKKQYEGKPIFLSYEEVDPKYPNYEQRLKRVKFYQRNGFFPINFKTQEFFINYQVACSDPNATIDIKTYRAFLNKTFGKLWALLFFKEKKA